jgi:hypothetical protein
VCASADAGIEEIATENVGFDFRNDPALDEQLDRNRLIHARAVGDPTDHLVRLDAFKFPVRLVAAPFHPNVRARHLDSIAHTFHHEGKEMVAPILQTDWERALHAIASVADIAPAQIATRSVG